MSVWAAGRVGCWAFVGALTLGAAGAAESQSSRVYQVGVVHLGGTYQLAVDGLRAGLKEQGLEEGKRVKLHVRDAKGDVETLKKAARELEAQRVDLIYAVSTTAATATRQATERVPIVFYAGADPVALGLVGSFPKPGGRLTGVHGQLNELSAKRVELLKALVPKARRMAVFYRPDNAAAVQSVEAARGAAAQLKVELVERRVASVDELHKSLQALRPDEADAILYVGDALVVSQIDHVIEVARAKRLPALFQEQESVAKGALASYGVSYRAAGQLSAKQVRRILEGAQAGDLPVEQLSQPYFALNLKTAGALGLTISPSLLTRADEVIQ
ncbi:MAG TPA: ABC transporter substrate-binding protein [Methylomirabilota bacterium]|nr:ABC transporter substrate-binding protein [Methylomirabilota bacterium]